MRLASGRSDGRVGTGAAMVLRRSTMETIGVRAPRRHAGRSMAGVVTWEPIEITDRGRSAALVVPAGEDRRPDC
jgi:hypothetical protein